MICCRNAKIIAIRMRSMRIALKLLRTRANKAFSSVFSNSDETMKYLQKYD